VASDPLLVQRTRATPSQVGLSQQGRQLNVKGAFALSPARALSLRGRRVVVIDDVITTGATVDAVTRVLKRGGAAQVDVLALTLVTDDIVMPG
jgi:predicted amidophosphoribosyltransferase